jgi:hypothetical protein
VVGTHPLTAGSNPAIENDLCMSSYHAKRLLNAMPLVFDCGWSRGVSDIVGSCEYVHEQSPTADKRWPFRLGLDWTDTCHRKGK